MEVLSLALYFAELGLVGIVLYFVIGMIAMPEWATRICQGLLILIFVLAAVHVLIGGGPRRIPPLSPIPPGPASIIR